MKTQQLKNARNNTLLELNHGHCIKSTRVTILIPQTFPYLYELIIQSFVKIQKQPNKANLSANKAKQKANYMSKGGSL